MLSETSTIDIDEFGLSNNDSDEQEDYNKSMGTFESPWTYRIYFIQMLSFKNRKQTKEI